MRTSPLTLEYLNKVNTQKSALHDFCKHLYSLRSEFSAFFSFRALYTYLQLLRIPSMLTIALCSSDIVINSLSFLVCLLRYDLYIDRLVERMVETSLRGITFEEFRDFCSFLNQLEDFAIAMRMYTMADQPISQGGCLYGYRRAFAAALC